MTQFSEIVQAVRIIFVLELEILCLLLLIAVNFHGNAVNSFVSGCNMVTPVSGGLCIAMQKK